MLCITDDEHELEEQQSLKSKPAIDDSLYDEMMDLLETSSNVKMSHQYSYRTKKIYDLLRKGGFHVNTVFDPVLNKKTRRIIGASTTKREAIVPKVGERERIVKYFYERFKGEGARKLEVRISDVYTGIGRRFIQERLNQNQDHFRRLR